MQLTIPIYRFRKQAQICITVWVMALCCVSRALAGASGLEEKHTLNAILKGIRHHSFREAHEIAQEAIRSGGESDDTLAFAGALALLNRQPKTRSNLDKAQRTFKGLALEATDADIRIAALYFLGRLVEIHRYPYGREEAFVRYRRLIEQHPDHFFGQLALNRCLTLALYDPSRTRSERRTRFHEFEVLGKEMGNRHVQSSFHFLMARASQRLGMPGEISLKHYMAAIRLGITVGIFRANALVIAGVLSEELGRNKVAVELLTRFLTEFPRDARNTMVKERLSRLRG